MPERDHEHAAQTFPLRLDTKGPLAGIAVLTLEQPGKPVVVLDAALLNRLERSLRALPEGLRGFILASSGERAFVAGADLKAIMDLSDQQLAEYLAYASGVYQMISDLPCPTAAAIHGATLGGGLELAMHCDALVAAPPAPRDGQPGKPYPVGLPEAGLGICPGWGGTGLLSARLDPIEALRRTASGKPLLFDEAVKAGLFDAVAPNPESLVEIAAQWIARRAAHGPARRDGAPLRHAGRAECSARVRVALDALRVEISETPAGAAVACAAEACARSGWRECLRVEQRELIRLRNTPAAKESIGAFFAKSAKR